MRHGVPLYLRSADSGRQHFEVRVTSQDDTFLPSLPTLGRQRVWAWRLPKPGFLREGSAGTKVLLTASASLPQPDLQFS